jgi:hypothetical protein
MVMARRPARLSEGDVAGRRNGLLDMVLGVFRTRTRDVGEMWWVDFEFERRSSRYWIRDIRPKRLERSRALSSAGDACSLIRSHGPYSRVGDESFPTKTWPKEEIVTIGSISEAFTVDVLSARVRVKRWRRVNLELSPSINHRDGQISFHLATVRLLV